MNVLKFPLLLLVALSFALALSGCKKDDPCDQEPNLTVNKEQLQADIETIDAYLKKNNIQAETHPSGIRYVIGKAGSGATPTLCGSVGVAYQGRLLSNNYNFDGTESPRNFDLNRLILGWQIGIPLIKPGGRITLYIPSVYGYGSRGAGQDIPPNANLIFDITLYSVD
jgi:FKBP-type peptidyl-prolyl cis-trans isomerase